MSSVITETMLGNSIPGPERFCNVGDVQAVRRIQDLHHPTHAVLF